MPKRNKALILIASLVFCIGLGIFLYPFFHGLYLDREQANTVTSFYRYTVPPESTPPETPEAPSEDIYADLRAAAVEYNETLYRENQAKLTSKAAYEAPGFDLTPYDLGTDVFAVLKIEALDLEMPVYLGASAEHMASGAAVLGQTSLPIGGENTNCVIAGHRGWKGADYFRQLPSLEIGEEVTITNLWETLTYRITEQQTIRSTDFGPITIRAGEDLLTLFTCDYGADGTKYRYLITCTRV